MKCIVLLVAIGVASGLDLEAEWRTFKTTFNRVYRDPREEAYRSVLGVKHEVDNSFDGTSYGTEDFVEKGIRVDGGGSCWEHIWLLCECQRVCDVHMIDDR